MMAKNDHGNCPHCGVDLNGPWIWRHFYEKYDSKEEADRVAEMYGADRYNGRFGRCIALYDRDRDETVAYACPDCNHTWDREDD